MCRVYQSPEPVCVVELAHGVQCVRINLDRSFDGLGEAHNPTVPKSDHARVGIVGEGSTGEEGGKLADIGEEVVGSRDLGEFTVAEAAVLHGGLVGIGFNLAVGKDEAAVLKVEADQGGVAVEEVSEIIVVYVP